MKDEIYLMMIERLIKENQELKMQIERLKEICKMHARAVDFYVRKLSELESELGIGGIEDAVRQGRGIYRQGCKRVDDSQSC